MLDHALNKASSRPLRGATELLGVVTGVHRISIHAPLAGRDVISGYIPTVSCISIHAPLAGRDGITRCGMGTPTDFNPRAPCGARPRPGWWPGWPGRFQSTRPLRGATPAVRYLRKNIFHFNPRAPCGARHRSRSICLADCDFNPRAPCGARPACSRTPLAR